MATQQRRSACGCDRLPPPPPPAAKYTSAQRFEGKVAVVTGAASGLGLATSERVLRDGGRMRIRSDVANAF
jgi:hypothetical protein